MLTVGTHPPTFKNTIQILVFFLVLSVHTIEKAELDRLAGQPFVINRESFEQIQSLTQA